MCLQVTAAMHQLYLLNSIANASLISKAEKKTSREQEKLNIKMKIV